MRFRTVLFSFSSLLLCAAALSAQTWTLQTTSTSGGIRDIAFHDPMTGIGAVWVLPGSADIIRTSDGGTSWTTAYTGINEGMTGVSFRTLEAPVVVGGTFNFGRVYTSGNQGMSWNKSFETGNVNPSFWALDFPSSTVGYAGGGNRTIFSTSDGGATWAEKNATVGTGGGQVIALFFLTEEIGWAITTGSDQDNTNGTDLYRTSDAGTTWELVADFFVARAVHFVDEETGYVAGYDGRGPTVWRTDDGGESWKETRVALSDGNYLNDIVFATDNPFVGCAVGGNIFNQDDGIILHTTDGGATWDSEMESLPVTLFAVDMPTQGTLYASGSSGVVYKSTRPAVDRPEPTAALSREMINFDTLRVGESGIRQITLRSTTAAGLRIDSIYLSDPDPSAQGVTLSTSEPAPTSLAGIDSLFITLRAEPTDTLQIFGMIHVVTNDATRPIIDIPYSGVVLPADVEIQPVAELNVTTIDFDSVVVNTGSEEASITITSGSSAPLQILSLAVDPSISAFQVTPATALPAILAEAETFAVSVTFQPVDPGPQSGVVRIITNDPTNDTLSILLLGVGREPDSTLSVRSEAEGMGMTIAPNPAREEVGVEYEMRRSGVVALRLYTAAGRLIRSTPPRLVEKGTLRTLLSRSGLTSGLYFVEIVVDGEVVERGKALLQ